MSDIKRKILRHQGLIIKTLIVSVIIGFVYIAFANIGVATDLLGSFLSLSTSFFYAIVIAYVLNPIVSLFERRLKLRRGLSIVLTYLIIISLILGISFYVVPVIVESISEMASNLSGYVTDTQLFISGILSNEDVNSFLTSTGIDTNFEGYIDTIGQYLDTAIQYILSAALGFSSVVFNLGLGLLIAIYILLDKNRLLLELRRVIYLFVGRERGDKILEFLNLYHKMIGTYVGIKAVDSTIIASIAFVLLNLVGSEYVPLLTVIVGVTNMIPYFGPFIGELVGFLFNIFVSPIQAVTVFFTLLCLQMFDGYYLDPTLIGNKLVVRPIWIIYAVVIMGGFFGPIGMLLASPTAAVIKTYYHKLLRSKGDLFTAEELPKEQ